MNVNLSVFIYFVRPSTDKAENICETCNNTFSYLRTEKHFIFISNKFKRKLKQIKDLDFISQFTAIIRYFPSKNSITADPLSKIETFYVNQTFDYNESADN